MSHKNTGTYLVVWNFLEDFVICWLIEQAHILELVPGFSFRPLLFGLLSTSGGGFRLGVLGLLWCLCHFKPISDLKNDSRYKNVRYWRKKSQTKFVKQKISQSLKNRKVRIEFCLFSMSEMWKRSCFT